jgi:hypothetical protein
MEITLSQYATELVAQNTQNKVCSFDGHEYPPNPAAQVFEVFFRKNQQYYGSDEESLGEDPFFRTALEIVAANEEPILPKAPGKIKKFFKALGFVSGRLPFLFGDDFVKVANVKAASLAEVVVKMQCYNWRKTEYHGKNTGKISLDLMHALGTDHYSMACGDVIKTPVSKYVEFTPDGFREVLLGLLPNRDTKIHQGYTHQVQYLIHQETGIDIVMDAYFKNKNEPTKEDIAKYINKPYEADDFRGKYLIKTDLDNPIPTILPLPYRIIKLRK